MTDWSKYKPIAPAPTSRKVDWSQFKPIAAPEARPEPKARPVMATEPNGAPRRVVTRDDQDRYAQSFAGTLARSAPKPDRYQAQKQGNTIRLRDTEERPFADYRIEGDTYDRRELPDERDARGTRSGMYSPDGFTPDDGQHESAGEWFNRGVDRGIKGARQTFKAVGLALNSASKQMAEIGMDPSIGGPSRPMSEGEQATALAALDADRRKALTDFLALANEKQKIPNHPLAARLVEAGNQGGVGAMLREFEASDDKLGFLSSLGGEQVPVLATAAGVTAATGGAGLPLAAGAAVGAGTSSALATFGPNVENALRSPVTGQLPSVKMVEQTGRLPRALADATKRTGAQAGVDAAIGSLVPLKMGGPASTVMGQSALQVAGGSGGEVAARLAAGDSWESIKAAQGEVALEGLAELIGAPGEYAGVAVAAAKRAAAETGKPEIETLKTIREAAPTPKAKGTLDGVIALKEAEARVTPPAPAAEPVQSVQPDQAALASLLEKVDNGQRGQGQNDASLVSRPDAIPVVDGGRAVSGAASGNGADGGLAQRPAAPLVRNVNPQPEAAVDVPPVLPGSPALAGAPAVAPRVVANEPGDALRPVSARAEASPRVLPPNGQLGAVADVGNGKTLGRIDGPSRDLGGLDDQARQAGVAPSVVSETSVSGGLATDRGTADVQSQRVASVPPSDAGDVALAERVASELTNNGKRVLYRGDPVEIRAKLKAAGLPEGMIRGSENGPIGISLSVSVKDAADKALSATTEGPKFSRAPTSDGIEVEDGDEAEFNQLLAKKQSEQQAILSRSEDFPAQAMAELGKNKALYRNQPVPGKTVAETAKGSGLQYAGNTIQDGARVHEIRVPQDDGSTAKATISEGNGRVWINVASLDSGKGGGERVYNAAKSYADNLGLEIQEDPEGLSESAIWRRPVQQQSMVMKKGSADNIRQDPQGFLHTPRPGMKTRPMKAIANRALIPTLREHLLTNYDNAVLAVPEIRDVVYDFNRKSFVTTSGDAVSDQRFDELAGAHFANPRGDAVVRTGDSGRPIKAAPVGSNTLKNAALVNTLLRASPSDRPAIMGRMGDIANGSLDKPLERILPSKSDAPSKEGVSASAVRESITKAFGARILSRLEANGVLKIVTREEAAKGLKSEDLDGVKGYYHDGVAYIVADQVTAEEVPGVLLHEVGVHYGMAKMLGAEDFAVVQQRMRTLRKSGDKDVRKAYESVPADTKTAHVDEEAIAYLVEQSPRHSLVQRIVAGIKRFLNNKLAIGMTALNNLSVADIRRMAVDALRAAAGGKTEIYRGPSKQERSRAEAGGTEDGAYKGGQFVPEKYSKRDLTAEQETALKKAGLAVDRRSRLQKLKDNVKTEWGKLREAMKDRDASIQATLDRFHGIKVAEQKVGGVAPEHSAYIAARLSTGLPSIMEGILSYGAPKWENGILVQDKGTKGLLDALEPVKGDLDDWLGWMVGRRAQKLRGEGRENLLTETDIKALLSLGNGKESEFQKAADDYTKLKTKILDVAEQAGLIDPESRASWDHAEYVPFYRDEDGDTVGPMSNKGLSGQSSGIRELKGGESNLADPLSNIVRNFTKLIDASLKNNAVKLAIENMSDHDFFVDVSDTFKPARIPMSQVKNALLERGVPQSVIDQMPDNALTGIQRMMQMIPPSAPNIVRVMEGGKANYYEVTDPLLLRALTAFKAPNKNALVKIMVFFKRLLTAGITNEPTFMLRNFLRDSGSAWAISDDRFKPLWDSAKGLGKTFARKGGTIDMMFAGGSFLGGYVNGGDPADTARAVRRALRSKGMRAKDIEAFMASIVDTPAKLWDRWQKVGGAIENANREAVYEAALKAGRSKAEAIYLAKDLMDFSMQGDSAIIQFFADVLPFFNARLQGLYKLSRAGGIPGRKMRKHVAARMGVIALGAVSLLVLNMLKYREGYEELEEWDRDTYFHFFPGTKAHFRIPKPFEIGLLAGTIPERITMALWGAGSGYTQGDRPQQTMRSMLTGITGTLAINPIPQAMMPLMEQWANKDFFTGRPIENMGDEKLLPEAREEWHTSDTAKIVADLMGNQTGLSAKRAQHLWEGYTGTLGAYALAASDWVVREVQDAPDRPERSIRQTPVIGALVRGDSPPNNTRYTSEFYELLQQMEQISGTIKAYKVAEDNPERIKELYEKYEGILGPQVYSKRAKGGIMFQSLKDFNKARDRMSDIRKDIEAVVVGNKSAEDKREEIERLTEERNAIAQKMVNSTREAEKRVQQRRRKE